MTQHGAIRRVAELCSLAAAMLSIIFFVNACTPQGSAQGFSYFQIMEEECRESEVEKGVAVIDRRNGNIWCVSIGDQEPAYMGTLNLDAIPEAAPLDK